MEHFPGQVNYPELPEEFQVVNGRCYRRILIDEGGAFWELLEDEE
jgi:hypothetical protein